MNRIRLLSENVANQIAAGEVVERPASVVKELVENAVDAGAGQILVEVQAGGRSLVRVTDDGVGMSKDDALLSLERHATSKIETAHDLAAISTFGFRGEALPSIASVSRFSLTTRERGCDRPEAWQVVVHGGKILEVCSAAGAAGTCVEVRQLFFNLPARRKFLRTEETENAHITHYLTLVALAHPTVGLTYYQDSRLIWQIPAAAEVSMGDRFSALRDRLKAVVGHELEMIRVQHEVPMPARFQAALGRIEAGESVSETELPGVARLWGYIGAPGVSRATREDQHIFVNLRPVEHRGLNFALTEGYHTALMKGRHPVCCLFLEVPPSEVDVNVHPSKREVRFHQEQFVRRFVSDGVRSALLSYHFVPKGASSPAVTTNDPACGAEVTSPDFTQTRPSFLDARMASEIPDNRAAVVPMRSQGSTLNVVPSSKGVGQDGKTRTAAKLESPEAGQEKSDSRSGQAELLPSTIDSAKPKFGAPQTTPSPISAMSGFDGPRPLLNVPLRLVGVVGRLYVVLESDRGLVLLDQHAAHERVLFEQMLRRIESGHVPSQRLLLAETVELSGRDAQFLKSQMETLNRLGVGLSEFGEKTFLLDALPPFVKAPDARIFVLDLIDKLKEAGEGVNNARLGEDVVAKTVCRHAVKANDPLCGAELECLVQDLRSCSMPYTCPHGRPTLIEMNYRELERKFGRTQ